MGDLALHLARSGRPEDLRGLAGKFPTAALAELCFEQQAWDEIAPRTSELIAYSTPKLLESVTPEPRGR